MVVTGIIAWPYYIYVFVNCKILLEDEAPGPMFGVICLVIHHILVFFLIWSFAMSIMVDPGRVPEWYARLEMERQGVHQQSISLSRLRNRRGQGSKFCFVSVKSATNNHRHDQRPKLSCRAATWNVAVLVMC